MEIKIKFGKMHLFLLILILIAFLGLIFVNAYNLNPDTNPGTPSLMGHSADEINVFSYGDPVNLQNHVNLWEDFFEYQSVEDRLVLNKKLILEDSDAQIKVRRTYLLYVDSFQSGRWYSYCLFDYNFRPVSRDSFKSVSLTSHGNPWFVRREIPISDHRNWNLLIPWCVQQSILELSSVIPNIEIVGYEDTTSAPNIDCGSHECRQIRVTVLVDAILPNDDAFVNLSP